VAGPEGGPVSTTALGAASAAGTALALAGALAPATIEGVLGGGLALTVVPALVAAGATGRLLPLLLALVSLGAVAVTFVLAPSRRPSDPADHVPASSRWGRAIPGWVETAAALGLAVGLIGAAALAANTGEGGGRIIDAPDWVAGPGVVLAALLAAAAGRRPAGPGGAPLVVPALLTATLLAPGVPARYVLVVLVVALVAAAQSRRWGAGPALAALAVAALAAGEPFRPAGLLLAAAGALASIAPHPVVALAGLPGAATLCAALLAHPPGARSSGALAVGAAAIATLLAMPPSGPIAVPTAPLTAGQLPAIVTAAWLAAAPGSWGWAGADVSTYATGAARAVAVGLTAALAARIVRQRAVWR
jgi:hypothetical protein